MPRRPLATARAAACVLALALAGTPFADAAPPAASKAAKTPIQEALATIEASSTDPSAAARNALVALAIESPSARIRALAASALGRRADADEAVGSLLWRWSNAGGSREIALRAAKALGRIPADRAPRALWIRRQHDDASVAFAIRAAWLATATGGASFDTIATWARTDPSPFVRALAVQALARLRGDGAAIALLAAGAQERSDLVRDAIAEALATLPRAQVERDVVARLAGAKGEVRRHLFQTVAAFGPPARPEVVAAVEAALASRVPAGVAAALAAAPATPAFVAAARDRLASDDPVVRDAAIAAWVRLLSATPADAITAAGDATVPIAARTALLAAVAAIPTEAARDALVAIARTPITRDADLDVTATAVGALRRSPAPGARDALAALKDAGGQVGLLVAAILRAQGEDTRPRAFVVRGRLDRVEECLEDLGWKVIAVTSASELATVDPTPEDAIVFDGPGEIETHALVVLRRFLHLGGSVVLGGGNESAVWRALVPDALDAHPANLRIEDDPGRRGTSIADRVVYAADGVAPGVVAALEPTPAVMVAPRPVPLRTAAARPVLWSAEMEAEDGVTGCVAAEVRMGCGRILAIGALMGLRGVEAAEGWYTRVRVDRLPGSSFPNDVAARRRVAFDWFGIAPDRIALLAERGAFTGDAPAVGMADLPAARFLAAWLRAR